MENREVKYEIPRLDIVSIISGSITLKLKKKEIDQNYETSSINKNITIPSVECLIIYKIFTVIF